MTTAPFKFVLGSLGLKFFNSAMPTFAPPVVVNGEIGCSCGDPSNANTATFCCFSTRSVNAFAASTSAFTES